MNKSSVDNSSADDRYELESGNMSHCRCDSCALCLIVFLQQSKGKQTSTINF